MELIEIINKPLLFHLVGCLHYCITAMQGHTNIRFLSAKQAKGINSYKNTKRRLYRTTAAIWYSKICEDRQVTPNYIAFKINGSNRQCTNTATHFRLNQKIKFLYIKKVGSIVGALYHKL